MSSTKKPPTKSSENSENREMLNPEDGFHKGMSQLVDKLGVLGLYDLTMGTKSPVNSGEMLNPKDGLHSAMSQLQKQLGVLGMRDLFMGPKPITRKETFADAMENVFTLVESLPLECLFSKHLLARAAAEGETGQQALLHAQGRILDYLKAKTPQKEVQHVRSSET